MNEFVGLAPNSADSRSQGIGEILRRERAARRWSQELAAHHFAEVAKTLGISAPNIDALRIAFSRWENGHHRPSADSVIVLRHLYGGEVDDLGDDQGTDAYVELRARIASAAHVDHKFVQLLAENTESLRIRDRTFGAAMLFDQVGGHVRETEQQLHDSLQPSVQQELAGVLSDASAMAGWQALDAGAVHPSWAYFQLAEDAAREAENPILLAHATAERAYVLIEAGDAVSARQLIRNAEVRPGLPPLLLAWLAAAEGECAAVAGDYDGVLRAFDTASALLPTAETSHEALPFLVLDDAHLARWRGSALAKLAHPQAVDELTAVLAQLDSAVFVRAAAGAHTDLATAHARSGNRHEAQHHLRQGVELSTQIGSKRLLNRLRRIRLPLEADDAQ